MRPAEIAVVLAAGLGLALLAVLTSRRGRARAGVAVAVLLAGAIQLVAEGFRWQMMPAYGLISAICLLAGFGRRPGPLRRITACVLVAFAVVVLLIAVALPVALPVFRFPRPAGPYAIGTLTYRWTDPSRREIFSADPGERRRLVAQVWYPAASPEGPRAPYVDDADAVSAGLSHTLAGTGLLHVPGFFFAHFGLVATNAVTAARVARGGPFPVLIYLTGLGGFRQASTFQIQELVSRGYVVVGVDQPYTAAAVTVPGRTFSGMTKQEVQPLIDQSLTPTDPAPTLHGRPLPGGILPYLARDVGFVLDQLTVLDGDDPDEVLTGQLDMRHVGAFGVSLGAMATAEACRTDARLAACLMMDAAMPADVTASGLTQPAMWLTRPTADMRLERARSGGWSDRDIAQTQQTMRTTFAEQPPGRGYLVSIPGMFHVNFTDAAYWSPLTSQLGLTGPIDSRHGYDIVNAYTAAFFDTALRSRPVPLLDGPSPDYPDVIYSRR